MTSKKEKRGQAKKPLQKDKSINTLKKIPKKTIFFSLGIASIGIIVFFYHSYPELNSWLTFKKSIPIPISKIHNVELETTYNSNKKNSHSIRVYYEYKYNGKSYFGNKASIYSSGDNFGYFIPNLYNKIKSFKDNGGALNCYILPSDPSTSVINKDFRAGRFIFSLFFPSIFVMLGGVIILYEYKQIKPNK